MPSALKFVSEVHNLIKAVERKEKKVLYRAGGYGRSTIRRGMKHGGKKAKRSPPGQYPRYHSGPNGGLRAVRFHVDLTAGDVVIGPLIEWAKKFTNRQGILGGRIVDRDVQTAKTIPQLVNEGGPAILETTFEDGTKKRYAGVFYARPYIGLSMPPVMEFFRKAMDEHITPLV